MKFGLNYSWLGHTSRRMAIDKVEFLADFILSGVVMPILKAETDLYPAGLLDELAVTDRSRNWWAVHTKSRQEKSLARQLESTQVPFYLPLVPVAHLIRGKRVKSHLPLFGGYLFIYANDSERILTLATKRVAHILPAENQATLTRDLTQIRTLITAGVPLNMEARLEPGQRVRVKSGALLGMEGVIVARRGGDSLLVGVQFLQQGVSVLISDFQVEPL